MAPSESIRARLTSSFSRFDERLHSKGRLLLAVELCAVAAILVASGISLWAELRAMATTSLWNDELYTIQSFSSLGPLHVVTDYHVANNHVFFNLLNALTPGSGSFQPLRARLWSFVAVLTSLGLFSFHFARRRRYLEGAVAFALLANQEGILDLALQARGYGLLNLAAVVITLAVARYFETHANKEVWIIVGAGVLGAYTIPTFIVFAGAVLLILWLIARTGTIFVAGIVLGVAVAALYAPVYAELLKEISTYGEQWGEAFEHLSAFAEVISSYVWADAADSIVMLVTVVALVAPYHLAASSQVLAARFLAFSVYLTLNIFLFQRTPAVRTAFFIAIPLIFTLVVIGSELLRRRSASAWLGSIGLVTALALGIVVSHIRAFTFTPIEAWLDVAHYIEQHAPPGTAVHAPFRGHYLRYYLDAAYPMVAVFDPDAFAAGKLVFVDGDFRSGRKNFDPKAYSERGMSERIPQRRGEYQVVAYVPR